MSKAYLSIGSNVGDKVDYLDKAVDALKNHRLIHKVISSATYVTAPVGYLEQDDFVNRVLMIETSLTPDELLSFCHEVENDLDRVRLIRWGPRTIDLDILLYDDVVMATETLIIPHPRMTERGFVLIPLMTLEPDIMINHKPIRYWVQQLPPSGVRKM